MLPSVGYATCAATFWVLYVVLHFVLVTSCLSFVYFFFFFFYINSSLLQKAVVPSHDCYNIFLPAPRKKDSLLQVQEKHIFNYRGSNSFLSSRVMMLVDR